MERPISQKIGIYYEPIQLFICSILFLEYLIANQNILNYEKFLF